MFKDSLRLHALDKITTNIQSDFIFFMKIGFAANCKNRGKKTSSITPNKLIGVNLC